MPYIPFRPTLIQIRQIEKIADSLPVNTSWLLRKICQTGLKHLDIEALKAEAGSDPSSKPRRRGER